MFYYLQDTAAVAAVAAVAATPTTEAVAAVTAVAHVLISDKRKAYLLTYEGLDFTKSASWTTEQNKKGANFEKLWGQETSSGSGIYNFQPPLFVDFIQKKIRAEYQDVYLTFNYVEAALVPENYEDPFLITMKSTIKTFTSIESTKYISIFFREVVIETD